MLNYNQIPQAISNRQAFKANSCKATIEGNYYNIYSYSTLIYRENLSSKTKSFSYDYYSQTTSKLQNIISKVIYGVTIQQFRKVRDKLLTDNIRISPNNIALISHNNNLNLTSEQIVKVTDNL